MKKPVSSSFIFRGILCALCIFYAGSASASIIICTWNLENFGKIQIG